MSCLWGARQRHHQAQIRTEQSTHRHRNPGFPVNGGALWRQKKKKVPCVLWGRFLMLSKGISPVLSEEAAFCRKETFSLQKF